MVIVFRTADNESDWYLFVELAYNQEIKKQKYDLQANLC